MLKEDILCVIDFSEASGESLKSAVSLAEQFGTSVTVLYPYRLNQIQKIEDMSQTRRNMELAAAENFEKMVSEYVKDSPVTCTFRSEVGFLEDRVFAHTRKNEIGLIVISKRLIAGNKESFPGLVDRLHAPLLIV